jgi:hypothetical protein
MLARRQLRLAVVAAIDAIKTAAGIATVDTPGDWNVPPEKLPAVLLRGGRGRKESVTRGMAEFTSSATIEIEGRVEAADAAAAQDAIEALEYAIENAVFTDYNVMGMVQQIASVESEVQISSDGRRHLGGFKLEIVFEMFEAFDPTVAAPALTTWPEPVAVPVSMTSMGIHYDLMGTFDPSGTYVPPADAPPYTPVPAPRTTGPDGRDEAAQDIPLT